MTLARTLLLALMLCWPFVASADVAVPPLTGRVVDQTATLSPDEAASLEDKLKQFEERKGSQVAVLILPTTQPETIDQYSFRVVEQWKLGRKKIDDGVLLIVAKNDRKLRIEVGYGLEGALNDATAKRIIDEVITPKFRAGDFAGGITEGVGKILSVIDGEPLPVPDKRPPSVEFDQLGENFPLILAAAFVGGMILKAIFGRLLGSLLTGIAVGSIAWFVISALSIAAIAGLIAFIFTLISDGIGSGGGGRSSGGGFSSGRSSSGGFSGGGGSFGGGGASGSW